MSCSSSVSRMGLRDIPFACRHSVWELLYSCLQAISLSSMLVLAAFAAEDVKPNRDDVVASRQLATIKTSTTRDQVEGLLGQPSAVRPRPDAKPGVLWAYGSNSKNDFASIGVVVFDEKGHVEYALSPLHSFQFQSMIVTKDSMLQLEIRLVDNTSADRVELVAFLTNKNKSIYTNERGPLIFLNSVLEILDAESKPIYRESMAGTQSPALERHPMLIMPFGLKAEPFGFGFSVAVFGRLRPGTYLARLSYRVEKDAFVTSNAVKFEVPEARMP